MAFYGASYRVLAWLTTSLKVLPRKYFSESNYWQLAPDGQLQLKAVGCVFVAESSCYRELLSSPSSEGSGLYVDKVSVQYSNIHAAGYLNMA